MSGFRLGWVLDTILGIMFLCDNIDVYVFMCYVIVMICFMFRVIKDLEYSRSSR